MPGDGPADTGPQILKGKMYGSVDLLQRDFHQANAIPSRSNEGRRDTRIRIYGKTATKMPSTTRPGAFYLDVIESEDPNAFIDAHVYAIGSGRANLNVAQEDLTAPFRIDGRNIAGLRLRVVNYRSDGKIEET